MPDKKHTDKIIILQQVLVVFWKVELVRLTPVLTPGAVDNGVSGDFCWRHFTALI